MNDVGVHIMYILYKYGEVGHLPKQHYCTSATRTNLPGLTYIALNAGDTPLRFTLRRKNVRYTNRCYSKSLYW